MIFTIQRHGQVQRNSPISHTSVSSSGTRRSPHCRGTAMQDGCPRTTDGRWKQRPHWTRGRPRTGGWEASDGVTCHRASHHVRASESDGGGSKYRHRARNAVHNRSASRSLAQIRVALRTVYRPSPHDVLYHQLVTHLISLPRPKTPVSLIRRGRQRAMVAADLDLLRVERPSRSP